VRFRRTDYERIAARYDEFREQWRIPTDDVLDAVVDTTDEPRVLDLGCGTGIYLAAQAERMSGHRVAWIGLDPSTAMLEAARDKRVPASLLQGRAERLPFSDETFDYVFSSFAFHHFADKETALDEVARVLKPCARFRIVNVEPWSMPTHWVYRFFDGTREADDERFWPVDRIMTALENRGFAADVDVEISDEPKRAADLLAESESRTISQLAVVEDESYELGLKRLRQIVERDADAGIESVSAVVRITATRRP
jgi:ubiquinone/menaquinone biosynthesis C-methylase UbiE